MRHLSQVDSQALFSAFIEFEQGLSCSLFDGILDATSTGHAHDDRLTFPCLCCSGGLRTCLLRTADLCVLLSPCQIF
ncbi:hypothetical protein VNO77_03595 [Canavalia gladiata]|uniref:Uncharacterized protein n=1 Tax=Canavalia gladiata TaxID=3824 RepID=A0AAN9MX05_CANGL